MPCMLQAATPSPSSASLPSSAQEEHYLQKLSELERLRAQYEAALKSLPAASPVEPKKLFDSPPGQPPAAEPAAVHPPAAAQPLEASAMLPPAAKPPAPLEPQAAMEPQAAGPHRNTRESRTSPPKIETLYSAGGQPGYICFCGTEALRCSEVTHRPWSGAC